jgi:hypothetical protein
VEAFQNLERVAFKGMRSAGPPWLHSLFVQRSIQDKMFLVSQGMRWELCKDLGILDQAGHVAHVCLSGRGRREGRPCSAAKCQREGRLGTGKRTRVWCAEILGRKGLHDQSARKREHRAQKKKKQTYPAYWNHCDAFFSTNLCSSSSLLCFMSKPALLLWSCESVKIAGEKLLPHDRGAKNG